MLAKLPKPTPAAWAANQVAREEPDLIATLLDAGAALRAAQDAALAGGGAENLRDRDPGRAPRRRRRDARRRQAQARPASRSRARWPTGCAPRCTPPPATPSCARRSRPAGSWGRRRRAARGRSRSRRPIFPPRRRRRSPRPRRRPSDEDDAAAREAEERAERERLALEDELREARGTLKVRERVAKGAEEDAQDGGRSARRRAGRARSGQARPSRTRRPRRSQRSGCSRAPARSATRPATPSRGWKNAWIDGAPPLGSSRRWLN